MEKIESRLLKYLRKRSQLPVQGIAVMKAMSQKQIWCIQSSQRSPYAGVNKERTEFKRLWGFGRCGEPF